MYAIETHELTRSFGSLTAVDRVSIAIRPGEIFGLLGPNGAGKTTLISMLVTMKKPTAGQAAVNGFDVVRQSGAVRRSIGIVFQDPSLDEELTAFENLELHAAMYGIPKAERQKRILESIAIVELTERLNDVVKTFSGGMRRRLEIARGLLHYPRVLFLDEPTIGLDPQTRNHVWGYIQKLKKEHGITIVLTTHYLEEADSLCDRVAIIDHGRIIALDTPAHLKNSIGGDVVVLESGDPKKLAALLGTQPGTQNLRVDEKRVSIRVEYGEKRIPEMMDTARKNGIPIASVSLHKPTLDDVFLHHTGRTIRQETHSAKDTLRMQRRIWMGKR